MTATGNITVTTHDRELVITRIFDAPRELVFTVWTKPEHVVRWWGPNEFTLPFCEMDFRIGGAYKYCMRSPEGKDHWVWGTYREIVEPERIVFTWDRKDLEGNPRSNSIVTVTFADYDGRTKFTLRQGIFALQEDCVEHEGGWTECFDRLADYVENSPSSDKQ